MFNGKNNLTNVFAALENCVCFLSLGDGENLVNGGFNLACGNLGCKSQCR